MVIDSQHIMMAGTWNSQSHHGCWYWNWNTLSHSVYCTMAAGTTPGLSMYGLAVYHGLLNTPRLASPFMLMLYGSNTTQSHGVPTRSAGISFFLMVTVEIVS